uniref:hypothetical protein n=1 Tax=Rhodococcus qingshengii TaxID=334542 RepID=UPI001C4DED37|nr:hypothetical protein [Rhodococcus qingshengii]
MRTAAVGILLLLAVTGCSASGSNGNAPANAQPTSSTSVLRETAVEYPSPTLVPTPESNIVLTDSADLADAHPVSVTSYSLVDGARDRIAVHFVSGTPECFGAHASVDETSSEVTVKVSGGTLPTAVGVACTMEVVDATLDLLLDAPLGDRTVRNG